MDRLQVWPWAYRLVSGVERNCLRRAYRLPCRRAVDRLMPWSLPALLLVWQSFSVPLPVYQFLAVCRRAVLLLVWQSFSVLLLVWQSRDDDCVLYFESLATP